MKNKLLICLSLAVILVAGCNGQAEQTSTPAAFKGTWVFSSAKTTAGWEDANIDHLYVYSDNGEYQVKDRESSTGKVLYYNGRVYADASAFKFNDANVYTCKVMDGDVYSFESIPGRFTLVNSTSTCCTFDYEGEAGVKGYKFEKVESFGAPSTPQEKPDTPEEPEDTRVKIAGTVILDGNDLVGQIRNSKTGTGIQGVVVTDGYTCVQTDANGVYQLKSNNLTRIVYYSTPAEYEVATGSAASLPEFYKPVKPTGELIRTDFTLTPLAGGKETNWTFVGIGDPQCATSSDVTRYSTETIPDMKQTLSSYKNVYAMTLGDITHDSYITWDGMRTSMSNVYSGGEYIKFFQCLGNHDHNSLIEDTSDDAADDYNATAKFVEMFGPTDYSFDRGDVHVITMDDIIVNSKSTSSKSNKYTWGYNAGYTDKQYEWIKQDISFVADKDKKMVFLCMHIPMRGSATSGGASFNNARHYSDVMNLLKQFKEAHIMIGHTHYNQNWVHTSHICKGGLPIYEHIHATACGSWWTASGSSTVAGEPAGYSVYQIEGAHIKDWKLKGTRRDEDFQLRVFDGTEVYYATGTYPLNWYTATQKAGSASATVKSNTVLNGCFVAQVFNDDDTYWKVALYKKSTGEKIADLKRLGNGTQSNVAATAWYYNYCKKGGTNYVSSTASHYWYYKPASGKPSAETDWEIRAEQTLPGGTATHVYKCSALTTGSAALEKDFYFGQ